MKKSTAVIPTNGDQGLVARMITFVVLVAVICGAFLLYLYAHAPASAIGKPANFGLRSSCSSQLPLIRNEFA